MLHFKRENLIYKVMGLWYNYPKGSDIIANGKLTDQSMDFTVQIINLVKQLKEQRKSIIFA